MLNINFNPFPVLTTSRLILRQLEPDDDEEIFFMRSNHIVNKYLEGFEHTDIEQSRQFISRINNGIAANEWIFWAIVPKNDDKPVGTICLWNISRENEKAETGYALHPEFHGMGIMQEALKKVIEFGFQIMNLQTIEAYTHADNESSTRLLERNSFHKVGTKAENKEVIYALERK